MEIAYRGRPGAFADEAAHAFAGASDVVRSFATLDALFAALVDGSIDRAVVPVENSLAGVVGEVVERMAKAPVVVRAEMELRIAHVLVGARGATLDGVRRVHSHPIALAQCARFFASRLDIEPVRASDTASAIAEVVASQRPADAAIGSRRAAALYEGAILAVGLEDSPDNRTRFLSLARVTRT